MFKFVFETGYYLLFTLVVSENGSPMHGTKKPAHFEGKNAVDHVATRQAEGMIESSEMHGTEMPGHLSAFADTIRETAIIILILTLLLSFFDITLTKQIYLVCLFLIGFLFWKTGRSAWLGWARLERMHRIVEQERYEIQHHREQERDELMELYHAKGFEGELLDQVVDVLMADENRLLKVMVEEELALRIESFEHPLKQALGAGLGVVISSFFVLTSYYFFPELTIFTPSLATLSLGAFIAAKGQGNRIIDAIVWNLGIAALSSGSVYFLLTYLK